MFSLLRIMARSGGAMVASIALIGLAFYGIAQLSVMLVDNPGRALRILGVFVVLSTVFCFFVRWTLKRVLAQTMRPLGMARDATSRLVVLGGQRGGQALRSLENRGRKAGSLVVNSMVSVTRSWTFLRSLIASRLDRHSKTPSDSAVVIPLRRGRQDRKAE